MGRTEVWPSLLLLLLLLVAEDGDSVGGVIGYSSCLKLPSSRNNWVSVPTAF
jgi:hypothetical protein